MATIKAFTSMEQSRKLAEILPLESADMRYGYTAPYEFSDRMYEGGYDGIPYPKDFMKKNPNFSEDEYDEEFFCWSLAALLEILPEIHGLKPVLNLKNYSIRYSDIGLYITASNLIDACYEMILKLHDLNLL